MVLLEEEDLCWELEGQEQGVFAPSGVGGRNRVAPVSSQGGLGSVFDRGVGPRGLLPVFAAASAVGALLCGETVEAFPLGMCSTAGGGSRAIRLWRGNGQSFTG